MKKVVIVFPGEVHSQSDGDIHHIGVRQLSDLYGVRPDDHVIVYNPSSPWHSDGSLDEQYPRAIRLKPRSKGDYYDIHAED